MSKICHTCNNSFECFDSSLPCYSGYDCPGCWAAKEMNGNVAESFINQLQKQVAELQNQVTVLNQRLIGRHKL